MTQSPFAQAPATSRQATSREFFAVIFRRKWLIVGLFIVVTATVLTVALTTPVAYQSAGRVLVMRGERQSALQPSRQIFSDWEEDLGSEVEVAKSYPVMKRVRELLAAEALKNGTKAPKADVGSVDIEVLGKSNVLGIGYVDLNPEVAQQVCDALLTAYIEYRQERQSLGRPESFFDREMTQVSGDIDRLVNERQRFSQATGINDPEAQSRSWQDQLNVLEQRHNETASELAEAESALRAMRELEQHPDIDLPTLSIPFSNEAALVGLKEKITQQQSKIATLRERYRDDAPEIQNAMETLQTLQALLHKEVDARIMLSQSRLEMQKARLAVYDVDIRGLHAKLELLPSGQAKLGQIDAQVKNLRDRLGELAKARDQTRITQNTSMERTVILLAGAGAPVARNTRDYVRLALAPAFSLVVGIGLAFFIDGLDLTVHTASQAEEYLEMPVLASITERRRKRG